MKCTTKNCKNEAIKHETYGIIPCEKHQRTDTISTGRKFEFANISKSNRIQEQRDHHAQDIIQPYEGNKVNPDFFKQYPEQAEVYKVEKELEKI